MTGVSRATRCAVLLAAVGRAVARKSDSALQCMDGSGNPVDYWYILKHPNGFEYSYADNKKTDLSTPSGGLDADTSPLSKTLKQAYESGVAYAMWNDEDPDDKSVSALSAHAKGVIAFLQDGGFWLTHSEPKFPPPVSEGFSWQTASEKYGQSFLCLTVGLDALETVGKVMATNWPHVYDSNTPSFASKVSNFASWISNKHQRSAPDTQDTTVETVGGKSFRVFGKNKAFNSDLYSDLVAANLGQALYTETWQNGRGDLPASCGKTDVLSIDGLSVGGETWKNSQDHSKWAVTDDGKTVCFGDVNRQSGQFKRGGGTICSEVDLAKVLRGAITSSQSCSDAGVIVAERRRGGRGGPLRPRGASPALSTVLVLS
eukprot:CAMPEP_0197927242 /NCGR_PEP_ID=MMETSP1439-20131203/100428_1 /TAXON_ID=66791 /ORGANISM="Gonyaulax spinifera, Strain CCMP409" /LENGTH=372 /DNA_ID=CAMNT_0043549805 /DNA_START=67 /DNA_END=1183 /DNA_ORIENTATION=+